MVNIKGFHGTLDEKANKILNSRFIHSSKNSEWLGSGVYFFAKRQDAEWWADLETDKRKNQGSLPAVLSADIITEDEFFYDLDFGFNMNKMIEESRDLLEGLKGNLNMNEAEMRCVACNFFAKLYGIKVFAYTFPSIARNEIGFPYTRKQRQICVNDDDCIKNIQKVKERGG